MAQPGEVLVFDRPSPWREQLLRGLETDDIGVTLGLSAKDLVSVLAQPPGTLRAVVAGELDGELSVIDALYEASMARTEPLPGPVPVFLITDVRKDAEILTVLRRRGVSQFLDRR